MGKSKKGMGMGMGMDKGKNKSPKNPKNGMGRTGETYKNSRRTTVGKKKTPKFKKTKKERATWTRRTKKQLRKREPDMAGGRQTDRSPDSQDERDNANLGIVLISAGGIICTYSNQ